MRREAKKLMATNQTGVRRGNPSGRMCGGEKRRQTETNWEADATITNTLAIAITQNSLGGLRIAIKTLYLSVTSLSLSSSLLLPVLLWDQRLVARKKSKLLYFFTPLASASSKASSGETNADANRLHSNTLD